MQGRRYHIIIIYRKLEKNMGTTTLLGIDVVEAFNTHYGIPLFKF